MPEVSEANAPAEEPVVTGVTVSDRDRSVTAHLSDGTSKRVDAPGDPLNAAIEKAAGPVESEPAALVPEGAPAPNKPNALGEEIAAIQSAAQGASGTVGVLGAPSSTDAREAYEAALKAKAAALEAYIQAGLDKVAAAVGQTEIVTVAGFKLAVEALLRHLHADHPENYL